MLISVGIPVLDGKPHAALVDSLLAEQLFGFGQGVHFLVEWQIGCSLIGHARNRLLRAFLDTPEADCVVFVDADISWPTGALTRLAKASRDVIGATYRAKQDDEKFHVYGAPRPGGDLFAVDGLPGGFLKISRKAALAVIAKANRYLESDGTETADAFPMGFFDGTYYGEDYGFCRLWRETGGTVFLDPDIELRHHDGSRAFTGSPRAWLEAQ